MRGLFGVCGQAQAWTNSTRDGGASYDSTWTERTDSVRGGDDHDEIAAVGLSASWELDVWGRLRAGKRAAELGVDSVVGGRLERLGDNIVISASMIDTRDDSQIWGERLVRRARTHYIMWTGQPKYCQPSAKNRWYTPVVKLMRGQHAIRSQSESA